MSSETPPGLEQTVNRLASLVTSNEIELEDRARATRAILSVLTQFDLALGNQVAEQIEVSIEPTRRNASAVTQQPSPGRGVGQKLIAAVEWVDYLNPFSMTARPKRR